MVLLGFYLEEGGSPGRLWAEVTRPDLGAHMHPLVAASGMADCGGLRAQTGDQGKRSAWFRWALMGWVRWGWGFRSGEKSGFWKDLKLGQTGCAHGGGVKNSKESGMTTDFEQLTEGQSSRG